MNAKNPLLIASFETLSALSKLVRFENLFFSGKGFLGSSRIRRGGEAEFMGFREYTPSDDARFISHTASARLAYPMMRVMTKEVNERVFFVLDRSLSMFAPTKNVLKYFIASSIIASIFIKIQKHEGSACAVLFGKKIEKLLLKRLSARTFWQILREDPEDAKGSALNEALSLAAKYSSRSLLIIASDFRVNMDEKLFASLCLSHKVVVLYIKSEFDESLPFTTSPVFKDMESGEEVCISSSFSEKFREKALLREKNLHELSLSFGARFIPISTEMSLLEALHLFHAREK